MERKRALQTVTVPSEKLLQVLTALWPEEIGSQVIITPLQVQYDYIIIYFSTDEKKIKMIFLSSKINASALLER